MLHIFKMGWRVGKGKRKAANGEGHIVIFFVQYACGGFAAFFLPRGLQYGVCVVSMCVGNTILQTWQTVLYYFFTIFLTTSPTSVDILTK